MKSQRGIAAELRKAARERFARARMAERQYQVKLVSVAKHIAQMIRDFTEAGRIVDPAGFQHSMEEYSRVLRPWARAVSNRMIVDVATRDSLAWRALAKTIGRNIAFEIANAPTGKAHARLLAEQVELITSLPIQAGQRVHVLSIEAMVGGTRGEEVTADLMRTGLVTINRAKLISRTEVARTASIFTQTRAMHVGSEGYFWRTALDADVRPALSLPAKTRRNFVGSHRVLEGKFIKWTEPPVSGSSGERAHAGQIYNCRCYPEPVLPDVPASF